ncbi:hypothetical protein ACVZDO_27135 [Pseudomonas aeruginosa]|uniref:hypothetical protein n=1 Tax=Pseudomonas aeruginosa TaxID=287 RepID=UPI00249DF8CF|nr:hypothetical protein [Pseudomonas aeruginosa]MDI3904631.1 hypothetical protein [Pseudomonas aeruginosa]MDI4008031.1 hypothetical protein [Pseudomonas aeruginosa]
MNDYKSAFNAAAADLSAIIALLGFTKYPGVDPVLRAITDLILDKAENQVLREERDALARVEELERKLRDEENAHTTTIEQRDNAEHWADQLAKAIAERFGVDIGEHSNLNCPWNEALVWMQQPPAQAQHSAGYAEARMCANCRHIGINDAGADGNCPECGGFYELEAQANVPSQAQHSVPEGWKLVPVEPTEDVLEAIHNGGYVGDDQELRQFYQAILDAAPAPGGE